MIAPQPVNEAILADLVRRIVAAVHPRRMILFGSAARGQMTTDSDFDVLIVLSAGEKVSEAEEAAYRSLWGLGIGTDLVAISEDQLQRHCSNPYFVYSTALRDGREIYRAGV